MDVILPQPQKCFFLNENVQILIHFAMKIVLKDPIDN